MGSLVGPRDGLDFLEERKKSLPVPGEWEAWWDPEMVWTFWRRAKNIDLYLMKGKLSGTQRWSGLFRGEIKISTCT